MRNIKDFTDDQSQAIFSCRQANQLTFPYHILKCANCQDVSPKATRQWRKPSLFSILCPLRYSVFPKVYAADKEESKGESHEDEQETKYSKAMDALARAYIQRESGWDRIKMIFETDHRGKQDLELNYIEVAVVQVFILTFFAKYIPVAKFARQEFIRENQGTVFKTRFEAIRRLQDHTFLKASAEAAAFSTRMTLFSASFLLLSSMISSYRNKTSVLEYSVAAGITGGLARVNMGLKGFIAGSLVGGFFGSLVGIAGYLSFKAYGITQEERHLESIKGKLEIIRSIEGESNFRNKINEILAENKSLTTTEAS